MGTQRRSSSNYGSEQTNGRDYLKAREGARPQIKEVSIQTDVTSKSHVTVLVLKLRERANMTPKGHVRGPVLKLMMQANKQT